jgi:hypothetical protein
MLTPTHGVFVIGHLELTKLVVMRVIGSCQVESHVSEDRLLQEYTRKEGSRVLHHHRAS